MHELDMDDGMFLISSGLQERSIASELGDMELDVLPYTNSDLHHLLSTYTNCNDQLQVHDDQLQVHDDHDHDDCNDQFQLDDNHDHDHMYTAFLEDLLLEEEKPTTQNRERAREKGPSKNLLSERRRRQKINQRLYSLRSIVPNITKMDKASIVRDAISYVKELQNQAQTLQADIAHLELTTSATTFLHHHHHHHHQQQNEHCNILELEISKMGKEETYEVRIECKKEGGVLIQLILALETLSFDILSANLSSINDRFLNSLIVKANNCNLLETKQLREMILNVLPKFGLQL